MNALELKMVDALKDLRENHHTVGVKAEFEAEGTRIEEMLRLKEVCMKAGLDLTIKIGGCEALRDLYECRVIGVSRIVAPMIESPFALQKYIAATKLAYPEEERTVTRFLINIETKTGFANIDDILGVPEAKLLNGIVLGRVDMTGSLGLGRDEINSPPILDIARALSKKLKARNMEFGVGGGVSAASLPFVRELGPGGIDVYETRKVIFGCPKALETGEAGILKAVGFELMWLKNKRDYYSAIASEDNTRINMLEARYKDLIAKAGGTVG
jgi:4-hydroxy-2-oxoheptanedioate aldolase